MPKNPTPRTPKKNGLFFYFTFVKRKGRVIKEYRWHIYKQGRVIDASTQGYNKFANAVKNVRSIKDTLEVEFCIIDAVNKFKTKKK